MTNATIDTISGNSFTVVFEGGGAKVTLAPDAPFSNRPTPQPPTSRQEQKLAPA